MAIRLPDEEHSIPAFQTVQLVEIVGRWGVSEEKLLSGSGVSAWDLEDPEARIPMSTWARLVERARALTGEPGLGFYLGLQKRASAYGYLGLAATSAARLGEALDLVIRFAHVVTTSLDLRLKVDAGIASLVIDERVDIGSAREVTLVSLVVGLWQIASELAGRELPGTADLALPEPPCFDRFAHLLPNVRFDQPVTQLVFDASLLDLPLRRPDRVALLLAREQCERQLQSLGFEAALVERVRRLLPKPDGFRSLNELAALLHMSQRTLKRRLSAEGISFSALLDRERREKALLLLRSHELTLEQICERVGYSTVPNFVRAFRRWTGRTPGAYRRASRSV
jgi:AraC-like DNA-binding protein